MSRYQKGKTNLDFTEARDSEWQWHQLGHMQVCPSLQTDNHASTPSLSFYRPDALPATQPTASKQSKCNDLQGQEQGLGNKAKDLKIILKAKARTLITKFKVPVCSHYEDMNGGAKWRNWGGLGQLGVTRCHRQCHHSIEHTRLPIRL